MCWPAGKAERHYAGVTHVDVSKFDASDAQRVRGIMESAGVAISGLGYYPNALSPDSAEAEVAIAHIRKVIAAAALLGVKVVNTFIGRDWRKSADENWPRFLAGLAADSSGTPRRRRDDLHRELPDVLHRR